MPQNTRRHRASNRLLGGRPLLAGVIALSLATAAGCSSSSSADTPTNSSSDTASKMAASCGGPAAAWATLITDAQAEGTVSVAGPPNPDVNKALPKAFKDQFGIEVKYLAGSSGTTAQKIKSERAADIFSLDVFLAGGNTMATVVYGSKWLADLKAALVSPALSEAATWQGTAKGAPFVDEPNFNSVAKLSIQGQEQFIVNSDLVKDDELTSWADLMDPKWKGKIVAMDPTRGAGLGFNVALMVSTKLGREFVKDLFTQQKIVLQTDDRQAADGVAKGQFAVAIGVSEANGQIDQLIQDGLPIRVITEPTDTLQMVSAGYGELGLMAKAPHPSAAKLFANWILCPDGNQAWNAANRYQSARKDVDIKVPAFIKVDVNKPYWDTYSWSLLTSDDAEKVLQQLNEDLK